MMENEKRAAAFAGLLAALGRPEECFRTVYLDDKDAAEYLSLLFHTSAGLFDGSLDTELASVRKWYRAARRCGAGLDGLTETDLRLAAALCHYADTNHNLMLVLCEGETALPYVKALAPDFLLSVNGTLSAKMITEKTERIFLLRGRTDPFAEALEYTAFLSEVPIGFASQKDASVKSRTSLGIALSYGGRLYHLPRDEGIIPSFVTAMEAAEYLGQEFPLLRQNVARHHKTEEAVFQRIL